MKRFAVAISILAIFSLFVANVEAKEPAAGAKIRVLLTTGGHPFERDAFFAVFDALPGIQYSKAELPKDAGLLRPGLEKNYDVLVRYDMVHKVKPQEEQAFQSLMRKGIGLVALHHSINAHPDWPEYRQIIGGRWILGDCEIDGRKYHKSTWLHGQEMHVTVADHQHPITRGLADFTIHDETYGGYYVSPAVTMLLTTNHPKNDRQIAWITHYGPSRVAYLQLGHDSKAWGNPAYPVLLERMIRWAAGRLPE
jgi:type 1 glutamine amidotransferase